MKFSNIGHVYGTDANLLSMCNYFPQPMAAFLNRYLNQSPNQIGLKYYYKFDKAKHLDDASYWQDVSGDFKTQVQFPVTPRVHPREHVLIETMYDQFYSNDRIEQKEIELLIEQWRHMIYPDAKHWSLLANPPELKNFCLECRLCD